MAAGFEVVAAPGSVKVAVASKGWVMGWPAASNPVSSSIC